PAYMTLTFTDPQFGDQYETPMFDILTATDTQISTLLKALPNQVLADYQDVGNNVVNKVSSVTVTQIDSGNYYRIWITFAASLGNVATLTGTPYFKCQGGAEVLSNNVNFLATYAGDGPNYDLIYNFANMGATHFDVTVSNSSGALLNTGVTAV